MDRNEETIKLLHALEKEKPKTWEEYLTQMGTLCEETPEYTPEFQHVLYTLGTYFYGIALYFKEKAPHQLTDGTHDFYLCLSREYTKELYQKFFLPWFQTVKTFVETKEFPKFLPVIRKSKKQTVIDTYQLVTFEECKISSKKLPGYFQVIDHLISEEEYQKMFQKYCKRNWQNVFEQFLKEEYPIYQWIASQK